MYVFTVRDQPVCVYSKGTDQPVCVYSKGTDQPVCVYSKGTDQPVCVYSKGTDQPVCVYSKGTDQPVCVSGYGKTNLYVYVTLRPTCMCLQSCPRAGNWIRMQVIGHLSGTLMAVCSTPSSPLIVELLVTLEKFLLTVRRKTNQVNRPSGISNNYDSISEIKMEPRKSACGHNIMHGRLL